MSHYSMPHHPVYRHGGTVGELVLAAAFNALGVLIMTSVKRNR